MKAMRIVVAAAVAAAVLGGAASAQQAGWPATMTIGTASEGGTYFIYGNGLAKLISDRLKVATTGVATGGPVENVTLVHIGVHQLGLVTMGPTFAAWTGKSPLAPGLTHKDVRALFPMYQTPFQVVALKSSGIKSIADLEGKKVSLGPSGGTPAVYWPRFFQTLGVKPTVSHAGAAEAVEQLKSGAIDAFAFGGGLPIPAFADLAAASEGTLFAFTAQEQQAVLKAIPELAGFSIPRGTYKGVDAEQPTVALWNFAVARKDLPDTLAYEITKLVLDNNAEMKAIHGSASETIPGNATKNGFLPFHAGAVRYYREKGIAIPDNLKG